MEKLWVERKEDSDTAESDILRLRRWYFPMSLPLINISDDRSVAEVSIVSKDVPGVMALVSSILASKNINIMSGLITSAGQPGKSILTLFIDYTGTGQTIESIRNALLSLKVIEDVNINTPIYEGLLIEQFGFPLLLAGRRYILMSLDCFNMMVKRMQSILGTSGLVLFYEMGKYAGEKRARHLKEVFDLHGWQLVMVALSEVQPTGWGVAELTVINEEEREWRVTVKDLFECTPFRDSSKECRSHFFRGYLEGVFKEAYELDKSSCIEEKCIASGSETCEFVITGVKS
jgi:predicted hydrocarbon binding protein